MKKINLIILGMQVTALAGAVAVAAPTVKDWWKRIALDRKETRIWTGMETLPGHLTPEARLRIPSLDLERLVVRGARESDLKQHVACLDESGPSLFVFGHRDIHFRPLKDLREGSVVELEDWQEKSPQRYLVKEIEVVDKDDLEAALRRGERPGRIGLVTCHPFYFVGPAPCRYIAWAEIEPACKTPISADTTAPPRGGV